MWFRLSQLILRNRILILIIIAGLTGLFGYFAATNVKVNTKFANMLPPEDPMRQDHDQLKEMFGEDGNIMVIGVENVDLFKLENFQAWYDLGEELKKIEGIDSVFSVAHMYALNLDKDEKRFKLELITKGKPTTQEQVDSVKDVVMNQVFYKDIIYKKGGKLSLMLVTVNAKKFNGLDRGTMIKDIYEKTQEYESKLPDLRYSGLPYIRDVVANSVKDELKVMIALAGIVTALILFLFYRSIIVVIACLIVVFIGVIWSFGTVGMLDYRLTMIMGLIPPLIIVIGIPNCTYLLNKYHAEYVAHGNKIKALSRVIQKIGNATFMTNMTTAMGFGTFIFTNSSKMQQFGVVAFINIIAVFLISICLIPIIFSFLNPPTTKHTKHLEKKWVEIAVSKLVLWVTSYRKWVYAVTILIAVMSAWGLSKLVTTGNISSDLPNGNPVLEDLQFFEKEFGGVMPFEVIVDANTRDAIQNKHLIHRLDTIQRAVESYRLDGNKIFARSLSVADAIKYLHQAFQGGDSTNYNLGIFDMKGRDRLKLQKYLEGPEIQVWKKMRTKLLAEGSDSMKVEGIRVYLDSFPEQKPSHLASVDDLVHEDSLRYYDTETITAITPAYYASVDSLINARLANSRNVANGFVDSSGRFTRISFQIADIGTREMDGVTMDIRKIIDGLLNPAEDSIKYYKSQVLKSENKETALKQMFASEFIDEHVGNIRWTIERRMSEQDSVFAKALEADSDHLFTQMESDLFKTNFDQVLNENIFSYTITGTSVVFAKGTTYLVSNLITSLLLAVLVIAVLMAILFSSIRMVLVSLVPNFIPLLVTAGIMGWAGIPIKPSTVLVFSIAFGISIDDTIHFLAKYRQELKNQSWNIRGSVLNSLSETGVSMIYTSIVLFFGFCVFMYSSFGGTVALGLLVSITLLIAMLSNLVVLPSLLLWLDKTITNKAFKEPLLEIIDEEEDIELDNLEIQKDE